MKCINLSTSLFLSLLLCSLTLPFTASADFDFDEMQQLEQAEQADLLAEARKAAKAWNFSTAENYLKQAEQKGHHAPGKLEAVRSLIKQQRQAKAAKKRREREIAARKRREEEARRQAAVTRNQTRPTSALANDMQNWCLAASGKYPVFCSSINDRDIQNACFGMTQSPNSCYSVDNKDIESLCLAHTNPSRYRDYCYSIENRDMKIACLGIAENKNNCYSVNNGYWKELCMGIAMASSNCYNIR